VDDIAAGKRTEDKAQAIAKCFMNVASGILTNA